MTVPGNTANGACVIMPPNSAGIMQQSQEVSGVISQTSPMVQSGPQHSAVMNPGSQPLGSVYPRSLNEQITQLRKEGMMKIFVKAQPKPLGVSVTFPVSSMRMNHFNAEEPAHFAFRHGHTALPERRSYSMSPLPRSDDVWAIQILIGLIHIGFGGISATFVKPYASIFGVVGYPFWGGLLFIVSGSLSVAAENNPKICLVRGSRGMNGTSGCASAMGMVLLIMELILSGSYDNDIMHDGYVWVNARKAIMVMLLLCTTLECSIAITISYFASQAMWYTPNTAVLFQPYGASANAEVPYPPMPPPPPYTNMAYEP